MVKSVRLDDSVYGDLKMLKVITGESFSELVRRMCREHRQKQ